MDASKKTWRAIQKERQITQKTNLGNSQPVTEGVFSRTRNVNTASDTELSTNLPKIDSGVASRFRTPRPAVAPRQGVAPRRPNNTSSVDGFVRPQASTTPVTPVAQQQTSSQPNVSTELAPAHSMAEALTRIAVSPPNLRTSQDNQTSVPQQEQPITVSPEIQTPAVQPIAADAKQPLPRRRMPGIDMELPGEESPERGAGSILKNARLLTLKRWALRGAVATVAIFLIGGALLFAQGFFKLNKAFNGGAGTAAAMKQDPDLLKGEGSGRINVLLLGRGGGTHDAPDLTDTIILASIDPVNHKTTLFSLPRDLWVNVPSAGNMKLNAVYETGVYKYVGKRTNNVTDDKAVAAGFKMVDKAVEDIMGVNVDYNVMVDFKAFSKAVNTVGGVNVTVPSDLVDPTMAWENKNNPVLAKAGPQVMDGKKALMYVRSRQTSDDFARSQRQRTVLLGLKTKIDSLGTLSNPVKLSQLAGAFGDNVQTDLSLKNAYRLYGILKKIKEANTTSIGLADPPNQFVTTGNVIGQSVVLPKAGLFKYGEIQAFVRTQLKDPYILKERAKILVLNGTTVPGVATAKAEELKAYGYNVIRADETPNSGWTQTMLIDLSKNRKKHTSRYLEKRLGVTKYTSLPDQAIQTNGADFVIIIGSDKATSQ